MKGKLRLFLRRRRFYVHPEVQWPLLLTSLAHGLIAWLVLAASLFGPLMIQLHHADHSDPQTVQAAVGFLQLHRSFWIPSAISLALITISSIWISHRIAGPLIRFRRILGSIRDGETPGPEQLRKGDLLMGEMDLINEMSAALRERRSALEEASERLEAVLQRCQNAISDANVDELTRVVAEAREEADLLQTALSVSPVDPNGVPNP